MTSITRQAAEVFSDMLMEKTAERICEAGVRPDELDAKRLEDALTKAVWDNRETLAEQWSKAQLENFSVARVRALTNAQAEQIAKIAAATYVNTGINHG